jgi:hypothetical protein
LHFSERCEHVFYHISKPRADDVKRHLVLLNHVDKVVDASSEQDPSFDRYLEQFLLVEVGIRLSVELQVPPKPVLDAFQDLGLRQVFSLLDVVVLFEHRHLLIPDYLRRQRVVLDGLESWICFVAVVEFELGQRLVEV